MPELQARTTLGVGGGAAFRRQAAGHAGMGGVLVQRAMVAEAGAHFPFCIHGTLGLGFGAGVYVESAAGLAAGGAAFPDVLRGQEFHVLRLQRHRFLALQCRAFHLEHVIGGDCQPAAGLDDAGLVGDFLAGRLGLFGTHEVYVALRVCGRLRVAAGRSAAADASRHLARRSRARPATGLQLAGAFGAGLSGRSGFGLVLRIDHETGRGGLRRAAGGLAVLRGEDVDLAAADAGIACRVDLRALQRDLPAALYGQVAATGDGRGHRLFLFNLAGGHRVFHQRHASLAGRFGGGAGRCIGRSRALGRQFALGTASNCTGAWTALGNQAVFRAGRSRGSAFVQLAVVALLLAAGGLRVHRAGNAVSPVVHDGAAFLPGGGG